jgi:hypothetical protein
VITKIFQHFNYQIDYIKKILSIEQLQFYAPAKLLNSSTQGGYAIESEDKLFNITLTIILTPSQVGLLMDSTYNMNKEYFRYRITNSNIRNGDPCEQLDKFLLYSLAEYFSDTLIISPNYLPVLIQTISLLKQEIENSLDDQLKVKDEILLFNKIKNKLLYSYSEFNEVNLANLLNVLYLPLDE